MNEFLKLLLPRWNGINDQITAIFVYVIGVAFLLLVIYFFLRTFFQRALIKDLTEELVKKSQPVQPKDLHELEAKFSSERGFTLDKFSGKGKLIEAWWEFKNSLVTRQYNERQVIYKTDEASFFFSEDRLLAQHLNLRFWNSISTLLVGFGILGTFVGLVWGLRSFFGITDFTSDEIREAIKKLLPGISVAFVTSVWGMLTSLLFNLLEKWCINRVSRAIAVLQHALDQLFTLTTQQEIAFRQEDELAQQTAALKSFSTDLADKIKVAMDDIMSKARIQSSQDSQEVIQELRNVPDAISNAIVNQLEPNFRNLNTAAEELRRQSEKLDVLHQSLRESHIQSTQDNQKIIQGLHNAPNAVGKVLEPSLSLLNTAIKNLNTIVTESANEVKSGIELERQEIIQELRNTPNAISNAIQPIFNRLSGVVDNLNVTVTESKDDIQNEMVQGRQEILRELHDTRHVLSNAMVEELIPIVNNLITIVSNTQGLIEQGRQEIVQELHKLGQSRAQMETLIEMVGRASEDLVNLPDHVAQIAADMQELLKSAANQTDERFNQRLADMDAFFLRAAQTLQDIQQSAGTLLQLQNEQIETINSQLANSRATLARGHDMLQEMNASIKSVHQITETMQIVSQKLTEGAEKIEGAGQQLNWAGVAFNEGSQNALVVIRETADRVQDALNQSHPLLNDFTQDFQIISDKLDRNLQKFQMISEELNGIFAEIERGLNTYADTTRESIDKYLTDFSEQLAQASMALARNVGILRDSVERLTEMNESQLIALADSFEVLKESIVKLDDINEHPTNKVRE